MECKVIMEYFWKKVTKEGESPVLENVKEPRGTLSNTEHVKLRMNLRRPWRKAKY